MTAEKVEIKVGQTWETSNPNRTAARVVVEVVDTNAGVVKYRFLNPQNRWKNNPVRISTIKRFTERTRGYHLVPDPLPQAGTQQDNLTQAAQTGDAPQAKAQ